MNRTQSYITTVKNDSDGWNTISVLQGIYGKGNLRLRGRHSDREAFFADPRVEKNYSPPREYCGRLYFRSNENDINHKEIYAVREAMDELRIDVYHRSYEYSGRWY